MNQKIILLSFICTMILSDLAYAQDSSVITEGPENGTLLIIGGRASDLFYNKFMELVGGPNAAIVVIPTAATSAEIGPEMRAQFKKGFVDKGFNNVTVLHTRDLDEANSDEFIKPIKNAQGVWFSGGRQWRHADSYLDTKAHAAFNDLLDRGGIIAGSSAGATIQGSYLARGDSGGNTLMMGDHEVGLNFLTNVAIDQHLFARNRQFDLFEILDHKPDLLGIGLDEDTGIIVKGDRFSVIGNSYVAIYDGTKWSAERNEIKQLEPGAHDFYVLKQGDEYDLSKRKVVLFEDRRFVSLPKETLQKYVGVYEYDDGSSIKQIRCYIQNGQLSFHQNWNDVRSNLLIENSEQMLTDGAHIILKFQFKGKEITGFEIPQYDVRYSKVSE